MSKHRKHISQLNRLLRGELSAVEAYDRVIEKLQDAPEIASLRRIAQEHQQTADALKRYIEEIGEAPDQSSGPWGTFTLAVTEAAKLIGDHAALRTLREGEEHGLKEYEEVVEDDEMNPQWRSFIRGELMSVQREHIHTLDEMIRTTQ